MADVYKVIAAVAAGLTAEGISKSSKNTGQGFAYRSVDSAMNGLSRHLVTHGLVLLPRVTCVERESYDGKSSKQFRAVVTVEYDFIAVSDGSKHTVVFVGEGVDQADKSIGKALSMAWKQMVFQSFVIPVEGQPDADADDPEPAAKAPAASQSPGNPPPATTPAPADAPDRGEPNDATKAEHSDLLEATMAAKSVRELAALKIKLVKFTTSGRPTAAMIGALRAAYKASEERLN
jgi:hypothetical protein